MRSLIVLSLLLVGCTEPQIDLVANTRSRHEVVELTKVPDNVRCFVVINANGYMFDGLSCFPKASNGN